MTIIIPAIPIQPKHKNTAVIINPHNIIANPAIFYSPKFSSRGPKLREKDETLAQRVPGTHQPAGSISWWVSVTIVDSDPVLVLAELAFVILALAATSHWSSPFCGLLEFPDVVV